jgi:hypothetical protein
MDERGFSVFLPCSLLPLFPLRDVITLVKIVFSLIEGYSSGRTLIAKNHTKKIKPYYLLLDKVRLVVWRGVTRLLRLRREVVLY